MTATGDAGADNDRCPFDQHSPEYAARFKEILKDLRRNDPVAYTPNHGGYYVLTKYEDVAQALRDDATFSSEWTDSGVCRGISIPPVARRSGFIEMDPPRSTMFRRALMPLFSQESVLARRPRMHEIVTEAIDDFIELGECDLVKDFADRVPAMTTMEMLDLPVEGWSEFASMFHHFVSDAPPEGELRAQPRGVYDYIEEQLESRRSSPRDDRLTWILNLEVDGQRMTDEEVLETVFLLMVGGYDTTAALLSNVLLHLSRHDSDRKRLLDDPELYDAAGEEFLRAFTPVLNLARTVTQDVDVSGTVIPAGSRVLLSFVSANHDEDVFDDPDVLKLDRFPNRHQAFGLGSHRCIGSFIARFNLKLTLTEVLNRLPDYVIDETRAVRFPTLGANNGWLSLPATFSPGKRLGPQRS